MGVFLRVDINIAAVIVLGAVLLIAYERLDRLDMMNKKFFTTSVIVIVEIFFETITCVINGRPEPWLVPVAIVMHVGVFVTAPLLTYSWFDFVYSWISPSTTVSRRMRGLFFAPVAINFIITVLSPLFGWVFYINSINLYQRGPLFLISAAITYFYLLCGMALILKQRSKIIKQEFIPLLAGSILPTIGGLGQALFYGTLLMWSSAAFALVIVYIFLQQRMVHLDNLTGAWTRESFYNHIAQIIAGTSSHGFGAIYIDLDGLKSINDEHGHLEGDCAIKTMVQLLRSSLRQANIVARLGGDEFVVVTACESKDALGKIIERISAKLEKYNCESGKEYKLECSFGADIYSAEFSSIEQFLQHLDMLMYSHKRRKSTS